MCCRMRLLSPSDSADSDRALDLCNWIQHGGLGKNSCEGEADGFVSERGSAEMIGCSRGGANTQVGGSLSLSLSLSLSYV